MALHYTLVFGLLVTEMVLFLILTVPLPNAWRVKILQFVSTSRSVAYVIHVIKIALVGVLVLFIDAVNRMVSVTGDADKLFDSKADASAAATLHANRFYAQRNVYLTGFTLFMSFILTRTYVMIRDLSAVAESNRAVAVDAKSGKAAAGSKSAKVE